MVHFTLALQLAAVATAALVPRTDDDPDRYTVCGGDRGYVEQDSLDAATRLSEVIVTSDDFLMERDDCIFAHVNTTIVSLCNGNARDRHVNRDEVRRGIDQLISDCGLDGGFTGIHVVNNMTFAAYGIYGGINMKPPSGSSDPDLPGEKRSLSGEQTHRLSKRDCTFAYDGVSHFDCDWQYQMHDGICGEQTVDNDCQQWCELRRTGLLGHESAAPGKGGEAQPANIELQLENGLEISISNGFSIGVDGVFKEVVGAGLSYAWSITTTKSYTVVMSSSDYDGLTDTEGVFARWVYFPKLIESCGTVTSRNIEQSNGACGTSVCPPPTKSCGSEVTTSENVCILSPKLNDKGEAELYYAVRWEDAEGNALPLDQQSGSYKTLCNNSPDPDKDGEDECLTPLDSRSVGINYKKLATRKEAAT
ncbi:hypothetical protein F5Y18DRAFT_430757 [Xylariaceae sp. FL1019]|nr:hypothetical protein F5Y18DRAFT_430757 [Xylariaceae sp. FL1019]